MTKDEENDLRKAFTFENFKKLLYHDILAEVSEDVLETIEEETNTFLGIDNN